MTVLSFDEQGVDVVYEGTEFRLEKASSRTPSRSRIPT